MPTKSRTRELTDEEFKRHTPAQLRRRLDATGFWTLWQRVAEAAWVRPEHLDPRHPVHLRRQHREIMSALRQLRRELKRSPSFRAETERCMFATPVVTQNGPIRLYARRAGTEDVVTFEGQPVEYLGRFINGKFSPADVAWRILTVHLHLKYKLGEQDDQRLYVRTLAYPSSKRPR